MNYIHVIQLTPLGAFQWPITSGIPKLHIILNYVHIYSFPHSPNYYNPNTPCRHF